MTNDAKREAAKEGRAKRATDPAKGSSARRASSEPDVATRLRIETELRNQLSGRDPDFAAAVLARVCGTSAATERKGVELWFEGAARALCDEDAIEARLRGASEIAQVALALLARHAWWSRTSLVQGISMLRSGQDETAEEGKALSEVLSRWPVLVRTNSWTRTEELALFEPLAQRLRPLLEKSHSVGCTKAEPLPIVGLGHTLLALALFPGLVAQRRPRVTRSKELHGADATKLERSLGEARGLFTTWERLGAFEEVDGALAPIASRVRRLLDDPGGLVAEFLEQRLGDLGWALASLAASAGEGDQLELGASLLAVGLRADFGFGFDVPSLAARIERDDLRFAPLLHVDASQDVLSVAPDVRAAIRGEPLAFGPSGVGFVQPNYEVVIPAGVPLSAAFIVGCAAELVHFEAVARMKLTRESVLAARSVGLDIGDVLAALEIIAGSRGLPAPVRHAIEEWGESVGEARIRTAVLLEVQASDALLDKVAERLSAMILDRPTKQLFVLSRAPNPRELASLRSFGVLTRAVAAASAKVAIDPEDAVDAPKVGSWSLTTARHPARDLRRAIDPHRILALVEASRPRKSTTPLAPNSSAPSHSSRGTLDPDDGAERPLPPAVDAALEERRSEWGARSDWIQQLRQIADSSGFRRAAATNPGGLTLAVRRASEPQRLQLEIARIVAEASVRRAAD
ncbi:MAG: hypothetical protein NVSMB1_02420 [Polyangiales bacterium]